MEAHATWLIDIPKLTQELSVAAGPDPTRWDRSRMEEMVKKVFTAPTTSTKKYLALINSPDDDEEAKLSAIQSVEADMPRWFAVVMAPALSPAGGIGGRSSILPKILGAIGWTAADAQALLLGDPLSELARTVGLEFVATQLTEARIQGWLSLNRISILRSMLTRVAKDPVGLARAGVQAADGAWAENDARSIATKLVADAEQVLSKAEGRRAPLRVLFEF